METIVVELENGADTRLLRRMIENMKGVIKTTVTNERKTERAETEEWIKKMRSLSNNIDSKVVDMSDERTQYIMGK